MILLRKAMRTNALAIGECVSLAYSGWISRIGQTPGPMLQDYVEIIDSKMVFVSEVDRAIVGVLVLSVTDEGFLLENVAVAPAYTGWGVGKCLLIRSEHEAKAQGYASLYLYTHEKMFENIALYAKNGYVEYDRREEYGFRRVFMRKHFRHNEAQPGVGADSQCHASCL